MCISAEALALFLNLIVAPISSEPGRITVHAEEMDTLWVLVGELWCTTAPQTQAQEMFAALKDEEA